MDKIQEINQQLQQLNFELIQLYKNKSYKSQLLTRKHFSQMSTKIYVAMESGTNEDKKRNKSIFLTLFRAYTNNFINNYVFHEVVKAYNEQEFARQITQKWDNFKRFVFHYSALFQHGNSYYQIAYKSHQNQPLQNQSRYTLKSHDSVYPVPAIALHIYRTKLLELFAPKIKKVIESQVFQQREHKQINRQYLRSLFQIVWSCGLVQLARIKITNQIIMFYKQQKIQFIKSVKVQQHPQDYFTKFILNSIISSTSSHYQALYNDKIRCLSPLQQISAINQYCTKEQQFANYFLITNFQRKQYLSSVYEELILNDIDNMLRRENGLRYMLQKFNYQSQQYFQEISLYIEVCKREEEVAIGKLEKLFVQVIKEIGEKINKKMNKYKEYIGEFLTLKKSMALILTSIMIKNLKTSISIEKTLKKLLDGIQPSKNLAEYTDFTIKECSKLKLDEENCLEKFKDLFIIMSSLSARDSYLIYHQQLMHKRLFECLNDPKIQIQVLFLKKLSEQLGAVSVASHFSMLRDIENSMELTEKYNNRLAFSSFKWTLKIFNPSTWPENANKSRLKIQFPNYLQKQANSIEDLYHQDHPYRFLSWKAEKGVSLFQGKFKSNKYRFQAENAYLMILLHINQQENNKILYGNLKEYIKEQKNQKECSYMQNYLLVLIENNLLIRGNDKNEPISIGEQISINENYQPPAGVKANQTIIIKASSQLMKNFHQNTIQQGKILKQREKLIQAVLVKLLKHSHLSNNNSITFAQLYQGIKNHHFLGNFNFSEGVIKQRLEELIAKEYCIRDETDRKIYHYIA